MKALVTGAAGFIGSHLVERLLDAGADVIGLDSFTDYYPRSRKASNLVAVTAHPSFRLVESSLQTADLSSLLDGVSHVFHLAAQPGVRKSWGREFQHYTTNNIEATQALLEACAGRPLERLVFASTSSVYGDLAPIPMKEDARLQPVSPYGVTKLAAEHLCFLYCTSAKLPAVALRYFTVYGPRQRPDMAFHRFLRAAHLGEAITLYGDGEQTRDFTFVRDAVEGTYLAGVRGTPGHVYNIGGGSRVSVNEVLRLVEDIVGRSVTVRREPPQKGDMRDTYADTSLARAELGYLPGTKLVDGLAAEYAWLKSLLDAESAPRR